MIISTGNNVMNTYNYKLCEISGIGIPIIFLFYETSLWNTVA